MKEVIFFIILAVIFLKLVKSSFSILKWIIIVIAVVAAYRYIASLI